MCNACSSLPLLFRENFGIISNSLEIKLHEICHKRHKFSRRKVLQFTGFHPHVGETFAVFASSVWKVLKKTIAHQIIRRENFRSSWKI